MNIHIRKLHKDDIPLLYSMQTGIDHDYILPVAGELMEDDNQLFGLFVGVTLASVAGYSIFAGRYAMLGRLRSDRRFQANGYATRLMRHVRDLTLQMPEITWVGGYTQENNFSGKRVMEKVDLQPLAVRHGAITNDVSSLAKNATPWTKITDTNRKRAWLADTYIKHQRVFPYECYYLFPSSEALFTDEAIQEWNFYENPEQTRFVITKKDRKKHHYLHISYPWNDIFNQTGLWKAVARDYESLKEATDEETYIWYDMPKELAHTLPAGHPWYLDSPWILYGMDKTSWKK